MEADEGFEATTGTTAEKSTGEVAEGVKEAVKTAVTAEVVKKVGVVVEAAVEVVATETENLATEARTEADIYKREKEKITFCPLFLLI